MLDNNPVLDNDPVLDVDPVFDTDPVLDIDTLLDMKLVRVVPFPDVVLENRTLAVLIREEAKLPGPNPVGLRKLLETPVPPVPWKEVGW